MSAESPLAGRVSFDPWGLFDDLPTNVSVVRADARPVYANRMWQTTFNPGGVALGDVDLTATIHPDDARGVRDAWTRATATGLPFAHRYRVRGRHGRYRWFSVTGSPTVPAANGAPQYACVVTDVDDAFRYEAYLEVLAAVGDVVALEADFDRAFERIGELLVPLACSCFVVYRNDDRGACVPQTIVHVDPARASVLRAMWRDYPAASRRFVELALATGEPVVVNDLSATIRRELAADDAHLALLEAYAVRDVVCVPIRGRDASHGVIALHGSAENDRALGDAEVRLAREIAHRLALALDGAALALEERRAVDDLRFLARVGEAMVESLDLATRLERFVEAVVPRIADWATVNLVQADGSIETLAIAHRDPAKAAIAERLRGPYYGDPESTSGTPVALRSGRSRLLSGVDERFLRSHLRPETYDDVVALGADSAFVVPLVASGEVYGTLSAMRVERERPFDENDMWLMEELARRAAVAIDNARRYEHHTTVADAFQRTSLPDRLPHVAGASFSAFYAPGKREATVGGDWYDAFVLTDGRLALSIGDVSGSGLHAAVIMGSVRQLVRGAAQLDGDPRVILDAADRALRAQFPSTLVTAFVAVVDFANARITYATAGHPPPLLVAPSGEVREFAAHGLPLGLRDATGVDRSASVTCDFADGTLLVLYTDGLTESTHDIIAGEAALHAALEDPTVRQAPDVARAVHDAVLRDGAHDDVAILAVRLRHRE